MDAYDRYARALVRKAERILSNREDARDVVQGLFADLLGRRDVPLDLPYLYRAVTNRCLTLLRDQANRARLLERRDDTLAPASRTPCDDHVIGIDLLTKLMHELDEGEADVLVFRYLDDMTQDEIASLLGLSRKTVGKRLEHIRETVARVAGGAT
ncbi:MAG TPA: sigma-70 family RNA polymerase sigma factor [Polyangiaceae bacterium]|jgi:RNA polymerase sigma-70 factor (ECF subfamily)